MDQTINYNLSKPGYEEAADINTINQNMDDIDAVLEDLQNKKVSWNEPTDQQEYWVATTGSDNNAGTSSAPFATLNRALSMCNPWKHTLIHVADGIYTLSKNDPTLTSAYEYRIRNVSSVSIVGNTAAPANVVIKGEFSLYNVIVNITGIKLIPQADIPAGYGTGIAADVGSTLCIVKSIIYFSDSTQYRGIAAYASTVYAEAVEIDNCQYCFWAENSGNITTRDCSGSGNVYLASASCGVMAYRGTIPSSANGAIAGSGGIILSSELMSYSKGVWGPALQNYTGNYAGTTSVVSARYIVTGKHCYAECTLKILTTGAGNLIIWGLPFTGKAYAVGIFQQMDSGGQQGVAKKSGTLLLNGTGLVPHYLTGILAATDLAANDYIYCSIDYEMA